MSNFFVNSGIDYTQIKESTSNSEWNSKDSFFTNQDENIYVKTAKETPDISKENCSGFFINKTDANNFIRNYSRGKSFKFSIWNEVDTYNNDNFVQDFVQWDQKLWAAKKTSSNITPSVNSEYWELVLEGVSNMEFRQVGNRIEWKYIDQDDSQWQLLFELDSVSEEEILEMLDDLNIKYKNPYDTELSVISTNAVQNKVITKVFNDQNITFNSRLDTQDVAIDRKFKLQDSLIEERIAEKQDILVSGENVKTINGESVLGEGNIEIQGGDSYDDTEIHNALTEVKSSLDNKQDALISGTNIKTINGESVLGEGNIEVESGISGVTILLPNDSTFAEDVNNTEFISHNQETYTSLYNQSNRELSVSMQYFGHNILCNPTMRVRFVDDGVNPYYDYSIIELRGVLIETNRVYRLYSDGKVALVNFNGDVLIDINGVFTDIYKSYIISSEYTQSRESSNCALGVDYFPQIISNGENKFTIIDLFGRNKVIDVDTGEDTSKPNIANATLDPSTNILEVHGGWFHQLFGPIDDSIFLGWNPDTWEINTIDKTITIAYWAKITGYKLTRTSDIVYFDKNLTDFLNEKVDKSYVDNAIALSITKAITNVLNTEV